jgi:hypothetical protein
LCSVFGSDPRFVEEARPRGPIDRNGNLSLDAGEARGVVALARTNEYVGTLVKGLFDKRFGAGALERPDAAEKIDRLAQLERAIRSINIPRMDRIGQRLCTDPEFDHRWAASPKYDNVARFFADEFRKIGFLPAGETVNGRRTYFDRIEYEQRFLRERGRMAATKNVYAVLPGTEPDPTKRKTVLVVVHADAISAAEMDDYGEERFPNQEHQGANDNAAACAATLEFCRMAKLLGGFKDDIMVWVTSAEEDGLLGTEAACVKPPIEPEKIRSAFVLEMIGRNAVDDLHVFGGETRENAEWNRFDDRVVRVAGESGIAVKRGKLSCWSRTPIIGACAATGRCWKTSACRSPASLAAQTRRPTTRFSTLGTRST